MIIDKVENVHLYRDIHPAVSQFFDYARNFDFAGKENFKEPLDDTLLISFSTYRTKAFDEKEWEAHDHCIDLQLVLDGRETLCYANRDQMNFAGATEGKDKLIYTGDGARFLLEKGYFAILFPDDVHKTKLHTDGARQVVKMVGKVRI